MAFNLNLGNISVTIGAKTDGFDRNMAGVKKKLKAGGKQLRTSVNTFGKWGAGIATAAGIASIAMFKMSASTIDSLAKTSDKLGIATEKLAGLRFAAEQTGISTTTMDMALQRMVRRLSEASQGLGEAKGAIEELGLDAEELGRQMPDEALNNIADALQGVENQSDKVRLAFKFFDSEGVALVNTLAGGSKKLNEFQKQAEKLGIALSRVDAKKVEEANDQLNVVSTMLRGIGEQATVKLAPIITGLAKAFSEAGSEAGDFGEAIDSALAVPIKVIGIFADGIHTIGLAFKAVEVIARGFIAAVVLAFEGLNSLVTDLSNAISFTLLAPFRTFIALGKQVPGMGEAFGDMERQINGIGEALTVKVPQGIRDFSAAQVEAVAIAKKELSDMAMEEIPSVAMDNFIKEARERAETEAAEAVKNIKAGATGGGLPTPEKKIDPFLKDILAIGKTEAQLEEARFTDKLERLKTFSDKELALVGGLKAATEALEQQHNANMEEIRTTSRDSFIQGILDDSLNEVELENQRFIDKMERLRSFNDQELEILGGFNEAKLQLEREHSENMMDLKEKERRVNLSILTSTIDAATQALSLGGKKTEKLQEKTSIINALIKGKEAAVDAWQAGMSTGGPFAPAVAAAYTLASIAKTTSIIRSIKSRGSSSGGGGGRGVPSVSTPSGGAPGQVGTSGTNQQASAPNKVFNFEFIGQGVMPMEQVRQLMGQFVEAINDGVEGLEININGG